LSKEFNLFLFCPKFWHKIYPYSWLTPKVTSRHEVPAEQRSGGAPC